MTLLKSLEEDIPNIASLNRSLSEVPTDDKLQLLCKDVGGKWRSFLIQLGIESAVIDAFWQKGLGEPENACFEGVQYWKKGGCKPVNWNTVLQALDKGAGMKEYATDLERILLSEEYQQRQVSLQSDSDVPNSEKNPILKKVGKSAGKALASVLDAAGYSKLVKSLESSTESSAVCSRSSEELERVRSIQIEEMQADLEAFQSSLFKVQAERDQFQVLNEELEKEIKLLKEEREESQKDLQAFQNSLSEMEETSKEKEKELEECKHENLQLKEHNQKLQKSGREWKSVNASLLPPLQHCPGEGMYGAIAEHKDLLAVADDKAGCVHQLTTEGSYVSSIGNGTLGNKLHGVAFDTQERLYISDTANNRIMVYSEDRLQVLDNDNGMEFKTPKGIAVTDEGSVLICDSANHRVVVYDKNQQFERHFGSQGANDEGFKNPQDICIGSDKLVYIVDCGNSRICTYTQKGEFVRLFRRTKTPSHIASTSCGHLVITSWGSSDVAIVTNYGEPVHSFETNGVSDIAVNEHGLVYVADKDTVQVF
jgi:hypothetical protein